MARLLLEAIRLLARLQPRALRAGRARGAGLRRAELLAVPNALVVSRRGLVDVLVAIFLAVLGLLLVLVLVPRAPDDVRRALGVALGHYFALLLL